MMYDRGKRCTVLHNLNGRLFWRRVFLRLKSMSRGHPNAAYIWLTAMAPLAREADAPIPTILCRGPAREGRMCLTVGWYPKGARISALLSQIEGPWELLRADTRGAQVSLGRRFM